MRDKESEAAWIVCQFCDEKKCVGRYNCKQIAAYIEKKEKGARVNET